MPLASLAFDGRIHYQATLTDEHSHGTTITVQQITMWNVDGTPMTGPKDLDEIGSLYVKWDACSEVSIQQTHNCSSQGVFRMLYAMGWAYNLACDELRAKGFDEDLGHITLPDVIATTIR